MGNATDTFKAEAEAADLEVEHYHGRGFWHGPAIRCDDQSALVAAVRATTVPVQWDNLGHGWILYPRTSEPGFYECDR